MNNIEESNFIDIKNRNKTIKIPRIQRDYAEGRVNSKVDEIRRSFLNNLLKSVFSDNEVTHLDFIYGKNSGDNFEPLDGQQRLTTLFLLYWFFMPEGRENDLIVNEKPVLLYATRITSEEFCGELCKHPAHIVLTELNAINGGIEKHNTEIRNRKKEIDEKKKHGEITDDTASKLLEDVEKEKSFRSLSEHIRLKDWFLWQWRNDASITSMLNVLDSIMLLMKENSYEMRNAKYDNLNNIKFHFLNLEDLEISDELYVKMNARGKLLSEFDILKSSIEEEIQLQGKSGSPVEADWRNNIDGLWIDFLWQKYSSAFNFNEVDKISYTEVYKIESKLMRLLQRLMAYQYFDCKNADFKSLCMQGSQEKYIRFFSEYSNLSWKKRMQKSQPSDIEGVKKYPEFLDVEKVINDMNSLIYTDSSGKHHFVTSLIPDFKWVHEADDFLEICINDKQERDLQVGINALLIFTRKHPANAIVNDMALIEDLMEWMRFVRNSVLLANTRQRIDGEDKQINAIKDLNTLYDMIDKSGQSVLEYLENVDSDGNTYAALENGRLEEQSIKSQCRKNNQIWTDAILDLESNKYLWGEIIAPLKWSMVNDKPDIEKFRIYSKYLKIIFNGQTDMNKFIACLLCIDDYRYDIGNQNHILLFANNEHRDRSWKNALRIVQGEYGLIVKKFIDKWLLPLYCDCKNVEGVWNSMRKNYCNRSSWRWCVIQKPDILDFSKHKYVYTDDNGHTFLREKIQADTTHRLVVFEYIAKVLKSNDIEYSMLDSNDLMRPNTLTFKGNRIGLEKDGKFYLESNECKQSGLDMKGIIDLVETC